MRDVKNTRKNMVTWGFCEVLGVRQLSGFFPAAVCLVLTLSCALAEAPNDVTASITSSSRDTRDSTPLDVYNFSWQVKLRSLGALRCSGVLIDTAWVLTAASCFDGNYHIGNYNVDILSVTSHGVDENDITSSPTPAGRSDLSVHVESFYLYGRYNVGSPRHNVALVLLHGNVTSAYIPADVIGDRDDVNRDVCLSVGWGSNETGEPARPTVRKWSVMNSTVCSQRHNLTVSSDEMCAQLKDAATESCTGDLGAPVVCKMDEVWKVAGIVSHTRHCHNDADRQEPQPTRFLSLQHYLPFVQKRGHFKDIGPLTVLS